MSVSQEVGEGLGGEKRETLALPGPHGSSTQTRHTIWAERNLTCRYSPNFLVIIVRDGDLQPIRDIKTKDVPVSSESPFFYLFIFFYFYIFALLFILLWPEVWLFSRPPLWHIKKVPKISIYLLIGSNL